ncbi:MAG: UPF0280 family protein [candidate division WOR-3 bacterium]
MKTELYIPRTYRESCYNKRFFHFTVRQKESDLFILAKHDLTLQANIILSQLRADIESYIELDKDFLTALKPIQISQLAPEIIRDMAIAGKIMNVGPMAGVAGAISEYVCRYLAQFSDEVIVENGGDNFIISKEPVTIAIYAGNSPLSMKIGIEIEPHPQGIAVATSSGTVGHSLSFGNADAVTVLARSGSLADAGATAICNMLKTENDITMALDFAGAIPEILGVVIIIGEKIGVRGEMIKLKLISN